MNGNNKSVFLHKMLLVVSIYILLPIGLMAQDSWKPEKLHFGIKLNPTFGYLHVENTAYYKSDGLKLGFSFAGTADYLLSPHFALTGELALSSMNGGTVHTSDVSQTSATGPASVQQLDKVLYRLSYLELPLAIKIKTKKIGEAAVFYLKLGIDPALKLSSSSLASSTTNGVPSIQGHTEDSRNISSFRASVLAGIGYDYRFNHDLTFTSGLLLNNGLTKINHTGPTAMTNSFLAIEFGVYF